MCEISSLDESLQPERFLLTPHLMSFNCFQCFLQSKVLEVFIIELASMIHRAVVFPSNRILSSSFEVYPFYRLVCWLLRKTLKPVKMRILLIAWLVKKPYNPYSKFRVPSKSMFSFATEISLELIPVTRSNFFIYIHLPLNQIVFPLRQKKTNPSSS